MEMTREQIVQVMRESEGCRIRYIDIDGDDFIGFVDVFETAFENSDDEGGEGASICVQTDDGYNVLLYEREISFIEII